MTLSDKIALGLVLFVFGETVVRPWLERVLPYRLRILWDGWRWHCRIERIDREGRGK